MRHHHFLDLSNGSKKFGNHCTNWLCDVTVVLHSSGILLSCSCRCQAIFLTSRHVPMQRVIFYISNTLRKVMI